MKKIILVLVPCIFIFSSLFAQTTKDLNLLNKQIDSLNRESVLIFLKLKNIETICNGIDLRLKEISDSANLVYNQMSALLINNGFLTEKEKTRFKKFGERMIVEDSTLKTERAKKVLILTLYVEQLGKIAEKASVLEAEREALFKHPTI